MTMTLLVGVGIGLLLGARPYLANAQTIDPHSLIGEWAGTWQSTAPDMATLRGAYILTIKKVDGDRIFCHVSVTLPRGDSQGEPVARLDGNRLSWGGAGATEFTISGNTMRGSRLGGTYPSEINLTKKK